MCSSFQGAKPSDDDRGSSAALDLPFAYAVIKLPVSDVDEELYNARFDTLELSGDDAWRSYDRFSRTRAAPVIIGKLEELKAKQITLSFRRVGEGQTWEELQAVENQGRAFNRRINQEYVSPELETYYRFDVTSAPSPQAGTTALNELVSVLAHEGGSVEIAYLTSDAAAPPGTGAAGQVIPQSHFKSASKSGMGIKCYQKRAVSSKGQGVSFVDLEQGWILDHPDLPRIPANSIVAGVNIIDAADFPSATNPDPERKFDYSLHGLMVLGMIIAKPNGEAVTGIAPLARPLLASVWEYDQVNQKHTPDTLKAMTKAIARLNMGDVLLIEAQVMPPARAGNMPEARLNVPVEASPHLRAAILSATNKGVVVIEAAGNNVPAGIWLEDVTFPTIPGWRLDPNNRSLATVVAAGNNEKGKTYQRSKTSNYGDFVDCFADGDFVWVLNSEPLEYIEPWPPAVEVPGGGTSSAAAIIAGVALILQSHAKSQGRIISPGQMRDILRDPRYGTASRYPNDRIGTMPDLKKILNDLPAIRAGWSM